MANEYGEYVEQIEKYLRFVAAAVRRRGRVLLQEYGITPPQFDALIVLSNDGDLTIGELSGRLYLAYSTTTDLVDRLERAGFVLRNRDLSDRRVVRVILLETGRDVIEAVLDARRHYLDHILADVDLDTRHNILLALERLHLNMANG